MNTSEKNIELQEWFLHHSEWQKRNATGDYYSMTNAFRYGYELRTHINALGLSETDENKLLSSLKKKVIADIKAEEIDEKLTSLLSDAEDKAFKKYQLVEVRNTKGEITEIAIPKNRL